MVKYNDHPLYCFLNPEEKKLLKTIVKSQSFMSHETIINLGERNRDIICLEEGSVSIQVEDFESNVNEITRIHSGNLVGEMNFIIPTRRTANVVALTFVEADIIPFAKLCALLKEQPLLAEKIFSALSLQLRDKYLGMINA